MAQAWQCDRCSRYHGGDERRLTLSGRKVRDDLDFCSHGCLLLYAEGVVDAERRAAIRHDVVRLPGGYDLPLSNFVVKSLHN